MSDQTAIYNDKFFENQVEGSVRSARIIVPYILRLYPEAKSVIDVGCGTGSWLRQYELSGISDFLGVDGFLPDEGLSKISSDKTMSFDLSKPLSIGRRFDIAQSLEVAEHLPSERATIFVDSLVALSDFIVFGAAIPGQGGTNHVNEQWHSYWAGLFQDRGYVAIDAIRPKVWYEPQVEWWYAQNTWVFIKRRNTALLDAVLARVDQNTSIIDMVHPSCFRQYRDVIETQTQGSDNTTDDLFFLRSVVPSRFRSKEWVARLYHERKSWKEVAFRHPLQIRYWLDLYRLQRRRARHARRGVAPSG